MQYIIIYSPSELIKFWLFLAFLSIYIKPLPTYLSFIYHLFIAYLYIIHPFIDMSTNLYLFSPSPFSLRLPSYLSLFWEFWDRIFLCISGLSETHYVVQVGLEFYDTYHIISWEFTNIVLLPQTPEWWDYRLCLYTQFHYVFVLCTAKIHLWLLRSFVCLLVCFGFLAFQATVSVGSPGCPRTQVPPASARVLGLKAAPPGPASS